MKKLKVLIGCETSGVVRDAFLARGHDAISCDLLPTESPGPHIQGDIFALLAEGRPWDIGIFFYSCTDLCVSGARYFAQKKADGRQGKALRDVKALLDCYIPRIALENPVGLINSMIRKPTQIIQPYEFGHNASKRTCLWLKNLDPLVPTNILPLPPSGRWENQTPSGQNKLGPSKDRWKIRSRTYQGIADCMAASWSDDLTKEA